jgi:maltooligosyltrehalose trehalohydrolase
MRSKLDLSERNKNTAIYEMHRDLLKLRREDPVFSRPRAGGVDGAVLGPEAFVLRFFSPAGDRLLIVNLGADLLLAPISEPLLAKPEGSSWKLVWSSESLRYGGCGTTPHKVDKGWRLPGHAALFFAARHNQDEIPNTERA